MAPISKYRFAIIVSGSSPSICSPEVEEYLLVVFSRFNEAKVVLQGSDKAALFVGLVAARHLHLHPGLCIVTLRLTNLEFHLQGFHQRESLINENGTSLNRKRFIVGKFGDQGCHFQ